MKLFNDDTDKNKNLLPKDGIVNYYGKLLSEKEANRYYNILLNTIAWKNDEAFMFGKHIITKRKVAWYADSNYPYRYSNITKEALSWTNELLELKKLIEISSQATYNACLLNLYHNGDEGMAWHSDNEPALAKDQPIASLTLGAERKFAFKHKQTKETISLRLENGSLLVMKDQTQTHWLHRLPPAAGIKQARVNLTFRSMLI